uniref:Uncharacterized protein n=1 Tax=Peronospora matthiolae TaxID=2874970 RepID=A0AAV1UKG0_9STRA
MRLVRPLVLVTVVVAGLFVSRASITEATGRQLMPIDVNAAAVTTPGRKSQVPLGAIVSSNAVHDRSAGGGKVTVTTYHNNGLWHRIKRWWKRLSGREEPRGSAKGRDMESRS